MDNKILNKFFECKTVSSINVLLSKTFDIHEDIKEVKRIILREYCNDNGLAICNTDEDMVMASMNGATGELGRTLAKHGVVVMKIEVDGSVPSTSQNMPEVPALPEPDLANQIPVPFKKIPHDTYDWACPFCNTIMREKDFSFSSVGDYNYIHKGCPTGEGKLIQHPDIEQAKSQREEFAKTPLGQMTAQATQEFIPVY